MYVIAENNSNWSEVKASTLAGAKRAAARAQMFQGSDIYVGVKRGDDVVVVAKKMHRDALNMSAVGRWQDA
jgi:hypothetical protein